MILFSFLIGYQLSEPAVIGLAFFTHFSGSCEDKRSKGSVFYFVDSFSIFAFFFFLV